MRYLFYLMIFISFGDIYAESTLTPFKMYQNEVDHKLNTQCQKLNNIWAHKYYEDFKIKWELSVFNCPSKMAILPRALNYIDGKVWNINGNFLDLYSWLKLGLKKITYKKTPKNMSWAAAVANRGKIYLYDAFFKNPKSFAFNSISLLLHEHRHNKKGDPGHMICKDGPLAKLLACDKILDPWGANGSGYSYEIGFAQAVLKSNQPNYHKEIAKLRIQNRLMANFLYLTSSQIKNLGN